MKNNKELHVYEDSDVEDYYNWTKTKSFSKQVNELWARIKDFIKHRIIWSQLATLIAFLFITVMGLIKAIKLLYGV